MLNLGNNQTGLDWNVTTPGTLTIRGFAFAETVIVGSGAYVNAGLSGNSANGSSSVRFWAGATAEERTSSFPSAK